MKTVLVTGAAGFIASKVSQLLLDEGVQVIGIDNLNNYYDTNLKLHRLDELNQLDGFTFHNLDIEKLAELDALFAESKPEAVVNLAARAGVRYSIENPHIYVTTNVHGSLNLLECMRKHDVNQYILASSSSLYAGEKMPFVETLAVNEPISPYAATKKAAEMMAYSYHSLFGINTAILRYFTVYGPAGRPDMSYFRFIKQIIEGESIEIYGDGSQARDFTYIDDIAAGTIKALGVKGYEIINLGGGNNPTDLKTMISIIEENLGLKADIKYQPFHKSDMKFTYADISKAEQLLAWKPQIGIEQGLKNTVDWFKNNKSWLKNISL